MTKPLSPQSFWSATISVGEAARRLGLHARLAVAADRGGDAGRILDHEGAISPERVARHFHLGNARLLACDHDASVRIVEELRVLDADMGDLLRVLVGLEIDAGARARAARVLEVELRTSSPFASMIDRPWRRLASAVTPQKRTSSASCT